MPKRILLAEESDTIRKIAESLLRQNGFEVLSMPTGAKAFEVLNFTSPDLIVVANDMIFKGDTTLYGKLQSDMKLSQIPLVLLANEDATDLPLPSEAVITKPFDPKEFIEKINLFAGQSQPVTKNPLANSDMGNDDEFLDMALGLDQLDVTDSEVMDKTNTKKIQKQQSVEKMIGFEHKENITDQPSDSGKVESLMIRDEHTDIKHSQKADPSSKGLSGTGKLDILDDQFGIVNANLGEETKEDSDHDYNWFLDELANDNNIDSSKPTPRNPQESQSLTFEDNASKVDPITSVDPVTPSKIKQTSDEASNVDKFIDEFKKEVEKFGSNETESVTLREPSQNLSESGSVLQWTDTVERINPQQIELFKKEFVKELAEKIAIKIADKIDSEKLLLLIKQEVINKAKNS